MQSGNVANTMRLGDYGKLLRRQWPTVLICLLLGIGLAFAYIQFAPREYRSLTSVLVTATDATAAALPVPADEAGQLADRVGVSVPPNTEILDITYTGNTAAEAQHGSLAF